MKGTTFRYEALLQELQGLERRKSESVPFSKANKGQKPLLKRGEMWKKSTQNYPEKASKYKHSF
jgi:hypothetical protein